MPFFLKMIELSATTHAAASMEQETPDAKA
jgi:hypothetical protein